MHLVRASDWPSRNGHGLRGFWFGMKRIVLCLYMYIYIYIYIYG